MAGMTNAEAAIRIIEGKASSINIAKAAENYSDGKEFEAAIDLYSAINALVELGVKNGLPLAKTAELYAVSRTLSKEIEKGDITANTIQDISSLGLTAIAAGAVTAGATGFAVVATIASVALGAYALVRPDDSNDIFESVSNALDSIFDSEPSVESSDQFTSPSNPIDQFPDDPGTGKYTGPIDNSLLEVDTHTTQGVSENPNFDSALVSDQVNTNYLIFEPEYYAKSNNNIVKDDGFFNTFLGGVISDGYRPGNQNLDTSVEFLDSLLNSHPDYQDFSSSSQSLLNSGQNNSYNTIFIDPLVLDLNGDGVQLENFDQSNTFFDIDHDGIKEQSGWVSSSDGLLAIDRNNNGKIDDVSELFSEYYGGTQGQDGAPGETPFANGFEALRTLDSNSDGVFNNQDAAWSSVKVWVDSDSDGETDAGELKSLEDAGVVSVNLDAKEESGDILDGNEVLARGDFVQNVNGELQTREAIAANFLSNPDGHTFITDGEGRVVSSQSGISSYAAGDSGETINVAEKGVNSGYGGRGDDTLIGDAGSNWLGGGGGSDSFDAGAGDDVLLIDGDDDPNAIQGGEGIDIVKVLGDKGVTLNLYQSGVEAVEGGRGNDIFVGGGGSNVFIKGGEGDDIISGGLANDALSGEDGNDTIYGGQGNDIVRGHRGRDRLSGGAGNDVLEGGLDDDVLLGDAGNDVLEGGQGDDRIDGGEGVDVARFNGSYSDYRITRTAEGIWVTDTVSGRDGSDFLTGIEKFSFSDVATVDVNLENPMLVKDVVEVPFESGSSEPYLISAAELLGNDVDYQGDALHITEISSVKGGTAVLQNGNVLFTPDPDFTGLMSFQYKAADSKGNAGALVVQRGTENSAEMKSTVVLRTSDMPSDPMMVEQWYLADSNILPVWKDYTGKGVKIAMFEPGGDFSVTPEIFDYRHYDLNNNVDRSWLAAGDTPTTFSNHATLVAGVMVADDNGEGAVGIAHDATLAGYYLANDGSDFSALDEYRNYDVVNNSWGFVESLVNNFNTNKPLVDSFTAAIDEGRDGLGTVMVFAGGNDRQSGGNTNYSNVSNNRTVITVGAINAEEDLGSLVTGDQPFSNPGASILVSAPGSNIASTSRELVNDNGSVFGDDLDTAQGTSFATPVVTGIVALMLEANPNLGYRDVQQILALTARKIDDPNTDWNDNGATNWNGGGMHASHDYGFGNVDALAAVRLAETWGKISVHREDTGIEGARAEYYVDTSLQDINAAIPDNGVLRKTFTLDPGIRVEHTAIALDFEHERIGDLTIKLISPNGTESILMNRPGKAPDSDASDQGDQRSLSMDYMFDTTHNWGENSGGVWTLEITDSAGGATGVLKSARLRAFGDLVSADDTYYYTNEFGELGSGSRATLNDANDGIDTINAAAVSSDTLINLNQGTTSQIAGRNLTIQNGAEIEHATTGDGNDTLVGNEGSNWLKGYRGNDTLSGGGGADLLFGGLGNDTLTGGAGWDYFIIRPEEGARDVITDFASGGPEKIILTGFNEIQDFTDVTLTQTGSDVTITFGSNQTVILKNQQAGNITEQDFTFISDDSLLDAYLDMLANSTIWTGDDNAQNGLLPDNLGNMTYFAQGGNDAIGAVTSNDVLDGGDGHDFLDGEYITNVPGSDWLQGGAGDDRLEGGGGDDLLFGGSGQDLMFGEDGNDRLYGDSGQDNLLGGEGNDLLQGGDDTLFLEGDMGNIDLSSTGANVVTGLLGGSGSDTFIVSKDKTGTQSQGLSSVNGVLRMSYSNFIADFDVSSNGDRIDLSQLDGVRGFQDITVTQNVINGLAIARLTINNGGQKYFVNLFNRTADSITADHFIFANSQPYGVVTDGNDILVGDAGGNYLDGGAGADEMTGRTGDDTYIVDHIGDQVNEIAAGGFDHVISSISYALGAEVESLTLTGSDHLMGTGNDQNNRIVGNAGNNLLSGMGGIDTLVGNEGNDIYVIDNTADRLVERQGEGTDTVMSSVSYTLGDHLENLTLSGSENINATGNELDNMLMGNQGRNILNGSAGDDVLAGKQGNDYLMGGEGNDTYQFSAGDGLDMINNLSSNSSDQDVLQLEDISKENLWFMRSGDNLLIDVVGSNDAIVIEDWYSSSNQQLDEIRTSDAVLMANKVDNLVNAMAGFNAPPSGDAQLPQDMRDQINPVIAANWQAA